jgi:hypothetical protein
MVAQAATPSPAYARRTVPVVRQRGGITTTYQILDMNNKLKKACHIKAQIDWALAQYPRTLGADHA